jgi:hypothetical protein
LSRVSRFTIVSPSTLAEVARLDDPGMTGPTVISKMPALDVSEGNGSPASTKSARHRVAAHG